MAYETVLVREDGPVTTISLNRPERRNALNTQICQELVAAFDACAHDENARAIVLTGEGSVFCAGQDLKFTNEATLDEWEEYRVWNRRIRDRIQQIHKPVVGRIQGHALGGGTWLATSCDLIVAARGAEFAMREIHAGVHSGGAHLFAVGRARSMEINMLGRRIPADQAEQWGLINRSVDAEDLDEAVKDFTDALVALPPLGLKYTKVAANLLLKIAGTDAVLDAGIGHPYLFLTDDCKEAKRSFVEHRTPNFTGARPQ
jgi:enoyl-CoA hydratase/carnithine racemase